MTVLDSFVSFAKRLPADQLQPVEAVLATLMNSYNAERDFNRGELAELDQRLAEPKPQFASQSSTDALLGRANPA